MDDFGSILERDYGFNRRGSKSRKNSSSSSSSNNNKNNNRSSSTGRGDNITRYSEFFPSSSKFPRPTAAAAAAYHNLQINKPGDVNSSQSLYDEVFRSSMLSTIPLFEDVFSSTRIKVSELRDNDIFRGVPAYRKPPSSRFTYEDIFRESPEHPSSLFVLDDAANSRPTTTSSRSSSFEAAAAAAAAAAASVVAHSHTMQDSAGEDTSKSRSLGLEHLGGANGSVDESAAVRVHGSCLKPSEGDVHQHETEPATGIIPGTIPAAAAVHNASVQLKRSWVTVDDVSLLTRASEIPPPTRHAPDTLTGEFFTVQQPADESSLESLREASGPPPARSPPPLVKLEPSHSRNCSLEQLLKSLSSQQAEESVTDKVLAWQRQNMAYQGSNRMDNSTERRSFSLDRIRDERAAVERIAAEVQREAEEQARLRAQRAEAVQQRGQASSALDVNSSRVMHSSEQEEEDGVMLRQQEQAQQTADAPQMQGTYDGNCRADRDSAVSGQVCEEGSNLRNAEAAAEDELFTVEVSEGSSLRHDEAAKERLRETPMQQHVEGSKLPQEEAAKAGLWDVQHADEGKAAPRNTEECSSSTQVHQGVEESRHVTIDSGSSSTDGASSVSVDTISGSDEEQEENDDEGTVSPSKVMHAETETGERKDEETAPDTPERKETSSHKKAEKSSEEEAIEAAWKADAESAAKVAVAPLEAIESAWKREAELVATEEQAKAAARQSMERTLVARITAEVRERAALQAKARVENEKVAKDINVKQQQQQQHGERRTRPRMDQQQKQKQKQQQQQQQQQQDNKAEASSSYASPTSSRVSLRDQLAMEKQGRSSSEAQRLRERSLVERIAAEARERARAELAAAEREKELQREKEKQRLQMLENARLAAEKSRLERLQKLEMEKNRERLERELELEREIEREKDRIGLEKKRAEEKARAEERAQAEAEAAKEAERVRMQRAAVERATAEARARAERAAYEKANGFTDSSSRSTSVPRPRQPAPMPSVSTQQQEREASSESPIKGETPERRKARMERFQRTMDRAAKALAQKNQRDMELQTEQAERQRLAERLDVDIRRWSVGKDGNIRALLSTLQYVLGPASGWKQVPLTELVSSAAVKKAYRRAALCVHPDKLQQRHASVQEKYIADKVFHILQVSWNKFNAQETQ